MAGATWVNTTRCCK